MITVRQMIEADDFSQITVSHEINFRDFLLLTDSKIGDYSLYHISEIGIQARNFGDLISCDKTESDKVYAFYEQAKLDFPTTAAKLLEWVVLQNKEFSLPENFSSALNAITKKPSNTNYPLPRQRHQELEILRVIKELGYKSKALPSNEPGKPGIKSGVRELLKYPPRVFDKAWQRLRDSGEIQNQ